MRVWHSSLHLLVNTFLTKLLKAWSSYLNRYTNKFLYMQVLGWYSTNLVVYQLYKNWPTLPYRVGTNKRNCLPYLCTNHIFILSQTPLPFTTSSFCFLHLNILFFLLFELISNLTLKLIIWLYSINFQMMETLI